jgi:purine nucleoside phosphorylase
MNRRSQKEVFTVMLDNSIIRSIQNRIGDFTPRMAIITGSGLGALADMLENKIVLPYASIENFIRCSVKGHAGEFHFGTLHNIPIVCLKGRLHYYEGASNEQMRLLPATLQALGCESLLITNAAGGIRDTFKPGDFMIVRDHSRSA